MPSDSENSVLDEVAGRKKRHLYIWGPAEDEDRECVKYPKRSAKADRK